ncbi:MAG: MATE family efflux transporter [Chordicoccus sp.]
MTGRAGPVSQGATDRRMETMPIPKLVISMGLPMMISMLGQALYNVVDTFYVSRIPDTAAMPNAGETAINALTLAFPVQMLIMALGVGTGMGVNAQVSRLLGKKRRREAENAAGNALTVYFVYFLAMLLFGIFGSAAFIKSQTADAMTADLGTIYVRIISVGSLGTLGYMCLEKATIATGRTKVTMLAQSAGALTNIVLDPVLIYGWLGLPAMGVRGAALATVVGQFISLIWIGTFYVGRHRILAIRKSDLMPKRRLLSGLFRIAVPAIAMQILVPAMSYGMNRILGGIREAAVTAYGIYYKLQNFIFMPAYGLNNASIPILSFNYGAGHRERISRAIRWALLYVTAIMVAGILLLSLRTDAIVSLFAVSETTLNLCRTALRIIVWGFPAAGINLILQGVCQALGNGKNSLVISLVRLILIPLPAAAALSFLPAAEFLVWLSIPLGEWTACVVAIILTKRLYQKTVTGTAGKN